MKYILAVIVALALIGMVFGACDIACTREYQPVCGVDRALHNQTFGNVCMFVLYSCEHPDDALRLVRLGECTPATD